MKMTLGSETRFALVVVLVLGLAMASLADSKKVTRDVCISSEITNYVIEGKSLADKAKVLITNKQTIGTNSHQAVELQDQVEDVTTAIAPELETACYNLLGYMEDMDTIFCVHVFKLQSDESLWRPKVEENEEAKSVLDVVRSCDAIIEEAIANEDEF